MPINCVHTIFFLSFFLIDDKWMARKGRGDATSREGKMVPLCCVIPSQSQPQIISVWVWLPPA
uniref:Uncharacterized protein n=1 Tax=Arundo donax TaxID=35708 RepID=A0A0A8XVC5_ARUDO